MPLPLSQNRSNAHCGVLLAEEKAGDTTITIPAAHKMKSLIPDKLLKPHSWQPSSDEQRRLAMAILKLAKLSDSDFHVIWSMGRYGFIVSRGDQDEKRMLYWSEALEITNAAHRRAEEDQKHRLAPKRAVQSVKRKGVAA